MRDLVLSGGPWDAAEREAILDYCESDVVALAKLLPAMDASIDLPRALLRGRYMKAAARIETRRGPHRPAHAGAPASSGGTTFRTASSPPWMPTTASTRAGASASTGSRITWRRQGIAWPLLPSGRLELDDDTFRDMAKAHPELASLRELRVTLGQMRLSELAVGGDGRNRCLLSAFRARTGRNQPSNTKFIFGPAVWLRGLIRPRPGTASPTSTGRSRSSASRPRCPAIRRCRRPTPPATRTWPSPSRPAPRRRRRRSRRTAPCGSNSRRACWRCSTAWARSRWRSASASRCAARAAAAGAAPEHLPHVLEVVRRRRRSRQPARQPAHGLRLADPGRQRRQPALTAQLPDAGQRRGDAAPGVLPAHRAGHPRLRAGP